MKNVNNIKPKRFDTYLNIYIGISPLFCYFPIQVCEPKSSCLQGSARPYTARRQNGRKKPSKMKYQCFVCLFSYYKTGGIGLFIGITIIYLTVAYLESRGDQLVDNSTKWQTSGEHNGSPPFAII
jgi:hypothetical protein